MADSLLSFIDGGVTVVGIVVILIFLKQLDHRDRPRTTLFLGTVLSALVSLKLLVWSREDHITLPLVPYCSSEELSRGVWQHEPSNATSWESLQDHVGYLCPSRKNYHMRCGEPDAITRLIALNDYRWHPHGCQTKPLGQSLVTHVSKAGIEHNRTGGILFVGDSISQEMALSFRCMMGAFVTEGEVTDTPLSSFSFGPGEGRVDFIRSDFLTQYPSNHIFLPDEAPDPETLPARQKWTHALKDHTFLVLNTGPHWHNCGAAELEKYQSAVEQTLELLRLTAPHVHLIYRSSVPGHRDCVNYTAPLTEMDPGLHTLYNWQCFGEMNQMWKDALINEPKHVYLDVDFTRLRPDGHSWPERDCLHYCLPGPIDSWNVLLGHVIQSIEV